MTVFSLVKLDANDECHYAVTNAESTNLVDYAERHYAECHNAEYNYAECHYAECPA